MHPSCHGDIQLWVFFSRSTSLGTGSFQLYSCLETCINLIRQKSEGEGTSAPVSPTSIFVAAVI